MNLEQKVYEILEMKEESAKRYVAPDFIWILKNDLELHEGETITIEASDKKLITEGEDK